MDLLPTVDVQVRAARRQACVQTDPEPAGLVVSLVISNFTVERFASIRAVQASNSNLASHGRRRRLRHSETKPTRRAVGDQSAHGSATAELHFDRSRLFRNASSTIPAFRAVDRLRHLDAELAFGFFDETGCKEVRSIVQREVENDLSSDNSLEVSRSELERSVIDALDDRGLGNDSAIHAAPERLLLPPDTLE